MNQNAHSIKQILQRHFISGLVVIVGSGLSCAEGLPSMASLVKHLALRSPLKAGIKIEETFWVELLELMEAKGIEAALHEKEIDDDLANFIRKETAECIFAPEGIVIQEVLAGRKYLKLSRLLPHLPSSNRLPIITTNYDRLIELAAEISGYQVDTKALGFYHASFSRTHGQYTYCSRIIPTKPRGFRKIEERCISLYKPHGSLDWTIVNQAPIRSAFTIAPENILIITPGQNKYKAGYEQPFDMQRELANQAISNASKFLIIGYGFNDNHLEVHLKKKILSGTPTLLMSRTLSPNAKDYQKNSSSMISLEKNPTQNGTIVHMNGTTVELAENLWDVEEFTKEVLGG
jgi:hypothetical protein